MAKKRKSTQAKASTGSIKERDQGSSTSNTISIKGDRNGKRRFESFPLHLVPNDEYVGMDNTRELQELSKGRVWVIPSFFSHKECRTWIEYCESFSSSSSSDECGFQYTVQPGNKYMASRECYRLQQENASELSERIFKRLQRMTTNSDDEGHQQISILSKLRAETADLYPPTSRGIEYKPIDCNPNIRVYRYDKGHSFGKHVDESYAVPGLGNSEMTMLVYLSSCQGGATRFYPPFGGRRSKGASSSFAFEPQVGALLLHVHGKHCLEHEADIVLGGQKYVLRTDLVYSNK